MPKLDGKVSLVTGGTSGIGLAAANALAKEGAHVYITGRREPELRTAVEQIGRNATGVRGDVSNADDLDRLFAQIREEKGRLDIFFANAGIARYAALGNITEELYDSIFNVNVKGVLFTVQKALPLMPDGGSIILNASVVGSKGLSSNSVYSATKASIRSLARTWTTDLKKRGIRVNAISPGTIDTPGLNWSFVLKKREGYRRVFHNFDPAKVARYSERKIQTLVSNPEIIRNRMKIEAAVRNARAFLKVQEELGD